MPEKPQSIKEFEEYTGLQCKFAGPDHPLSFNDKVWIVMSPTGVELFSVWAKLNSVSMPNARTLTPPGGWTEDR